MKEIMAFLRPNKIGATKKALEDMGYPSMTAVSVTGRGRQRGIAHELGYEVPESLLTPGRSGTVKYVPKRMLVLVVPDGAVQSIVDTLIKTNQTGQIGDGKIFIRTLTDAVRVRTQETGEIAL